MVVAVMALGIFLWNVSAPSPSLPAITQQEEQAIFGAVRQWLSDAHVQPQDMPKRIISAQEIGPKRYKVHMEMVQGDAWFECWWDGSKWQVKGLNVGSRGGTRLFYLSRRRSSHTAASATETTPTTR